MTFDFDEEFSRTGTHSVKWEFVLEDGKLVSADQTDPRNDKARLLSMSIADMDFRCPPAVVDALVDRAKHGVFGYSLATNSFYESMINWIARRQGWRVEPDWVLLTPGLVPALNMLVQTFVAPGEKVLIQPPVYYPFFWAVENNYAEVVSNPLINENGRYRMDLDDLAQKARDPAVKIMILCNPHNPVGRVWTREELTLLGKICLENDVIVVADEIHCDLIYRGKVFTPFARLGEDFLQNTVICTGASKSFNLTGLQTSSVIIPDDDLRARFASTIRRNGLTLANPFGLVASEAAYNHGEAWLEAAMAYIEDNYRYLESYLGEHLPQLKICQPQATYLVWVDFRELGLNPAALKQLLLEKARVNLDHGELFGREGDGFERFNIACPRSTLTAVLERIRTAINQAG